MRRRIPENLVNLSVDTTKILALFSREDKAKFLIATLIQFFLAVLDLLAITLVGLLAALTLRGIQSESTGEDIGWITWVFSERKLSFQSQVALLASIVGAALISRSFFSILLMRRILMFLSRHGATLSLRLLKQLLFLPLSSPQARSLYENLYSLTAGVHSLTVGILGSALVVVGDILLLITLAVGLMFINPVMTIFTFTFFVLTGIILSKIMSKKAHSLGIDAANLSIKSNEKIFEVFAGYREIFVRNLRNGYAEEIGEIRMKLAKVSGQISVMPYISKYFLESSVIVGGILICASQFIFYNSSEVIPALAAFLVASTRIAPAILRIQQGLMMIRMNLGTGMPTLELIQEMSKLPSRETLVPIQDEILEFSPSVKVNGVNFTYPNASQRTLVDINLKISEGSMVALVGPSGAGKTTLVDLILGVLQSNEGLIEISGLAPEDAISRWPNAIAYVPQEVIIFNGSVEDNICLGLSEGKINRDELWDAINKASLFETVSKLPEKEKTLLGDGGTKLSGGERQRLGIARALYSKPKLIILDEATSALDSETEESVSKALAEMKSKNTLIIIAHRLSTIRNADSIVFMREGRIIDSGSFDDVRRRVSDFDRQATLMGIE